MDQKRYLSAAISAAKEAGKYLMSQLGSAPVKYDHKNPSTKQDKDSELLILELLQNKFPEHGFLGEEFGEKNINAEYIWIIDPIDGTNNYMEGRDTFSVSIGLEKNKEIILGVVYLPKRDELFYAAKGNGSFLNGILIKAGKKEELQDSIITYSTYPGHEKETKSLNDRIFKALPRLKYFDSSDKTIPDQTFGRGSMAAEFCYLACGRIDGLVRLRQKPWDVAAGSIIAKEAGVHMNNLNGKDCDVYEGDYIAANPILLKKINKIIKRQKETA